MVKKGNTNLYYPQITKNEYLHFETISFFQEVHNGSVQSFLSALCAQEGELALDETQIAELKDMIHRL